MVLRILRIIVKEIAEAYKINLLCTRTRHVSPAYSTDKECQDLIWEGIKIAEDFLYYRCPISDTQDTLNEALKKIGVIVPPFTCLSERISQE